MYLILIIEAIFTPRKLSGRIKCHHQELKSTLIDAGMSKRYWCLECGAVWTLSGLAA